MFPLPGRGTSPNVPASYADSSSREIVYQQHMTNAVPVGYLGAQAVMMPSSSVLIAHTSGVPQNQQQVYVSSVMVQPQQQQMLIRAEDARSSTYAGERAFYNPYAVQHVQPTGIQEGYGQQGYVVSPQQQFTYAGPMKQGTRFVQYGAQTGKDQPYMVVTQSPATQIAVPEDAIIQQQYSGSQPMAYVMRSSWPQGGSTTSVVSHPSAATATVPTFVSPEQQMSVQMLAPHTTRILGYQGISTVPSSHQQYQQQQQQPVARQRIAPMTFTSGVQLTAAGANRLSRFPHEELYGLQAHQQHTDDHFSKTNNSSRFFSSTTPSRSQSTSSSTRGKGDVNNNSKRQRQHSSSSEMHVNEEAEESDEDDIKNTSNTGASSPTMNSGLGGEHRLTIHFHQYGTKGEHAQTFGKSGYFIPNGLKGTHRMYSQEWTFEITHEQIDQDDSAAQIAPVMVSPEGKITVLKWSIKNTASDNVVSMTETCHQAMMRQVRGNTICNLILRKALEQRIEELEIELEEDDKTPLQKANLRSLIKELNPKKCAQGLLFFGLRHECVQRAINNTALVTSDSTKKASASPAAEVISEKPKTEVVSTKEVNLALKTKNQTDEKEMSVAPSDNTSESSSNC